jgi:hypothetical protein
MRIAAERPALDSTQKRLDYYTRQMKNLELGMRRLQSQSEMLKHEYPDGLPQQVYVVQFLPLKGQYDALAGTYNEMSANRAKLGDDHQQRVAIFNRLVDSANVLAKKIGGTWLLIPLPGRGHGSH